MSKNVTRTLSRETLVKEWGLPYGDDGEIDVQILDTVDNGSGRWESYHSVIFIAPDDNLTYSVDYSRGLTENQHRYPWEDYNEVEITQVTPEKRVITVTDWKPVKELPVRTPKVPTKAELLAGWAANRADDAAAAEDMTW